MHKLLKHQKFLAGVLVATLIAPIFPLAALAQTTPTAGGASTAQSGNTLSSIVQDTTGAVAAAAIACNKDKIHTGIANLFSGSSDSSDDDEEQSAAVDKSEESAVTSDATSLVISDDGDGDPGDTGGASDGSDVADTTSTDGSSKSRAQAWSC